jgi:hypothetical protein
MRKRFWRNTIVRNGATHGESAGAEFPRVTMAWTFNPMFVDHEFLGTGMGVRGRDTCCGWGARNVRCARPRKGGLYALGMAPPLSSVFIANFTYAIPL